jgi:release factor glutamine methyltransferase
MSGSTLADALSRAKALGVSRLDAQLLLAHGLGRSRTWVVAHAGDAMDAAASAAFDRACMQRAEGLPLAYLTGAREFRGIGLTVSPAVLIPRPETEMLVDWALELLGGPLAASRAPQVLDLGTGSGAIAIAVAKACQRARVTATDFSGDALAVARSNARQAGVAVAFGQGDWWSAVGSQCFDLVLANPPYIADDDPHLADLRFEPRSALTSGSDGLDALRAICSDAARHLSPGGWLLVEHGYDQADAVDALLLGAGLSDVEHRLDLAGHDRCAGGRLTVSPA